MSTPTPEAIRKVMSAMGKRGTPDSKRRGNSEHYRQLAAKGRAKRASATVVPKV